MGFKAPGFCSIFGNFSICLWENSKTLISVTFGIYERVLSSEKQLFVFLETPGYLTPFKKIPNHVRNACFFVNLKMLEIQVFENIGKTETEQSESIRSSKLLEIFDMGSISSRKSEMDIA